MIAQLKKFDRILDPLRMIAQRFGAPILDLAMRLYLAHAFFVSGLLRLADWRNGSFDNQILLFTDEHPVPGLDPVFAAYSGMLGELILPVLVGLGLLGRFGAAGLLVMTAVIEFTYIHSNDHILWAFLAACIFIRGPGVLSVDHFFLQWLHKDKNA